MPSWSSVTSSASIFDTTTIQPDFDSTNDISCPAERLNADFFAYFKKTYSHGISIAA